MGNFIRLVITLTAIAAAASFGLSAVYNSTHEIAEEYKAQEEENARREVLSGAEDAVFEKTETDSILDGHPFVYYTARAAAAEGDSIAAGDVIGYTFKAYGVGYSSTIETVVGADAAGVVQGVKIIFQKETPGLGAKVEEIASENMLWDVMSGNAIDESDVKPWFQVQFAGKRAEELVVVKTKDEPGILAITGATISSNAVTGSVRRGLDMLAVFVGGGEEPEAAGEAPAGGTPESAGETPAAGAGEEPAETEEDGR